jgi:hypothetical protein
MEKASAAVTEKIKVLIANNLKTPQFNGKKGDSYLMWKMKFEADMVMKGLYNAFQPEFPAELPTKDKMEYDLMNKTEKKQHDPGPAFEQVELQEKKGQDKLAKWKDISRHASNRERI